ncbi:L-serine ammonia-lyase [Pacificibacter sp. AS14]|uniref:L-serine ammonia-lyase n=1 Tax=Pacificibacter sp. AS14 TaxID=3135785 RepID=UPI00317C692B
MFLSTFDVLKIGIGPSSSHTMGPMVAAVRFLDELHNRNLIIPGAGKLHRLGARLHGSLAFTGKGHATDRAIILGFCGFLPETLDPDAAVEIEAQVRREKTVHPDGHSPLRFDPESDLVFDWGPPLEGHANGLTLSAYDTVGNLYQTRTFFSIGGGFILTAEELKASKNPPKDRRASQAFPYPFSTAREMLDMGAASGKTIAQMKEANERVLHPDTLDAKLTVLIDAMNACIDRGLSIEGILPGGLNVKRRAKGIHTSLLAERGSNTMPPHIINDWISVYAIAVNEENAAGGRVVTSPTNGAAGVIPAVMRYYRQHCLGATDAKVHEFLLVASAIGGLIKHNASISGAEVGCQGEVGSAAAMAAAGLCSVLGGTNEQIENAAEIALEHHLGMSCDPAAGLVQVPCIERNALGAIKAVSAASLALRGDGQHFMPLDNCIQVMLETGLDMNAKYKETSTGGIAVNLPEC